MTTTLAPHPLVDGHAPAWAQGWGQDRRGVFVEIRIGAARQRMRWIPPGSFLMGSPETEAGRWEDEGPQRLVTFSEGFWLADTPCTQELWQAVMGENPSRFQAPRRPVERVSWEDCQRFREKLNGQRLGLELRLPTEAEWEYACRADTETATWVGDLEILGENNAPLLDEIAWYGGNSGVDLDLADGHDSSDWPEKQYPHKKAATRDVKQKHPNPWGLYDMLGNVWEWCADEEGTDRVIRGGSWSSIARFVRAAFRLWIHPSDRNVVLGFRLSRGRELGEEGGAPR